MDGMLLLRETGGVLTNEKINEQRVFIRVWIGLFYIDKNFINFCTRVQLSAEELIF